MKYLIMCEGPNEFEIIRMLLEHDTLIFTASWTTCRDSIPFPRSTPLPPATCRRFPNREISFTLNEVISVVLYLEGSLAEQIADAKMEDSVMLLADERVT